MVQAFALGDFVNNAGVMYLGITEAFSVAQAKEQMEDQLLRCHPHHASGVAIHARSQSRPDHQYGLTLFPRTQIGSDLDPV